MDYLNNYFNGLIAGFVATSVSHPAYNMKNVIQTGGIITNEMKYSPKWLYTGFLRAAIGFSAEKMLVFGTYNSLRRNDVNATLAGMSSGAIGSIVTTASEQLANDKQAGRNIYSLVHLYKGIIPTIARESIGFGVHFTVYNFLSNIFNKERDTVKTALCGTGAVIVGWSAVTPFDRIKTLVQNGSFDWKTYRVSDSFIGFRFIMMRAIPFHVMSFCTMEHLNKKNILSKFFE